MSNATDDDLPATPDPWLDACLAAALLAVDPVGLGGALVHAGPGPARDQWLALLRSLLPEDAPVRRVPAHVGVDRLLGGLDLGATLTAGRPVAERGLLAQGDRGVLVVAMAERLERGAAALLCAALDTGEAVVARDGIELRAPARVAVVALDESSDDENGPPAAMLDRLAFLLDLSPLRGSDPSGLWDAADIAGARRRAAGIAHAPEILEALCTAALALGIDSMRAPLLALRAAQACAALDGRDAVDRDDTSAAARLVLAPRATRLPQREAPPEDAADPPSPSESTETPPQEEKPPPEPGRDDEGTEAGLPIPQDALQDMILDATVASIPRGLLAKLRDQAAARTQRGLGGRAGAARRALLRGRPIGIRAGDPRRGARLDLIATLRTAAPWQRLRRRAAGASSGIQVRPDDFRITRFQQKSGTATIFAVDASGSAALHRLAEAKGAVELLLADCYVRRDRVAVVAFRGGGADVLLPPTRSLVRAKRSLAGLPGGGGTPLAAGLDAATDLAEAARRQGLTPTVVLLTDGRANIARDGTQGRDRAEQDALASARRLADAGIAALLLDTSPRPSAQAAALGIAMNARYLPLPHADSRAMSAAVRVAGQRR